MLNEWLGLPNFAQAPFFQRGLGYWGEQGRNRVEESVRSTSLPAEAAPLFPTFPYLVFLAKLVIAFCLSVSTDLVRRDGL